MRLGDRELRDLPAGFELEPGFHGAPEDGMCALEAVSWMAGLPHSDRPACVCPVLSTLLRAMNDHMGHGPRQGLIAILPQVIETRDPALAAPRAAELARRALADFAPIPLRAAGHWQPAAALAKLAGRGPEAARAALAEPAATVKAEAWREAAAKGARIWSPSVKVAPATWTSVKAVDMADTLLAQQAAGEAPETVATTAARLVTAVSAFDEDTWPLALGLVDALVDLGRTGTTVVRLDAFRIHAA